MENDDPFELYDEKRVDFTSEELRHVNYGWWKFKEAFSLIRRTLLYEAILQGWGFDFAQGEYKSITGGYEDAD